MIGRVFQPLARSHDEICIYLHVASALESCCLWAAGEELRLCYMSLATLDHATHRSYRQ